MKKYFLVAVLGLFSAQFSLAHSPFLSCEMTNEADIHCTGSFSDGSSTFGVRIAVMSYGDEVLFEGRLDKQNQIVFKKPNDPEYYIQFDADESHTFEVDYTDVKIVQVTELTTKVDVSDMSPAADD